MKHKAVVKRSQLRYYATEIILGCLIFLGLLLFVVAAMVDDHTPAPATSVSVPWFEPGWVEPYGGCDEAYLYPKSKGYAECKKAGLIP